MEKKNQNARMITQNLSFNKGKNGFGVICYLLYFHCIRLSLCISVYFLTHYITELHTSLLSIFGTRFFKHKK